MILQVFTNDTIFLKLAYKCFEKSDIQSNFIVTNKLEENSKYLPLRFIGTNDRNFFENELKQYKLVIFHSLLKTNLPFFRKIVKYKAKTTKLAWVIYGAEIERSSSIKPSVFLDIKTEFYYYYLLPYRLFFPVFRILQHLAGRSLSVYLRKIDYFAHFMPEEVNYITERTGVEKPMLWHSYAMLEDYIESSIIDRKCADDGNILIGNSASFTSNHLEIFSCLKKLDSGDSKIIVPLGYGNKTYRRFIVRKGKKYFGKHFVPLIEFMEKEQYHKLLLSCSVMILNHRKQQALGNIVSAAWLGMKIYIRKTTSTYKFFKRCGLIIFSIEEDFTEKNGSIFKSLNEAEVIHNRSIIYEIFSKEQVTSKLKGAFSKFQ